MDPRLNPYSPGAGTRPPELAGREDVLANAEIAITRIQSGRSSKGQMLLGLRGVGKTVLLNRIEEIAEDADCFPILIEAPEDQDLPGLLVPHLRRLLLRLDRGEKRLDQVKKALRVLASFAAAFRATVGEVEFGLMPEIGEADSGNLELDLPDLLMAVSKAAGEVGTTVVLMIDEVQYLSKVDLSALIVSIHKISQRNLPFVFFGAGLPQLAGLAGEAKSYAERLFDYPELGALDMKDALAAIREPAEREDVQYTEEALKIILHKTNGYPYFIQEWGSHAWNAAPASPIGVKDAQKASKNAVEQLDRGFFRVRFDQLTPREKDYMRAMAQLGAGPHRSGDVASVMSKSVRTVAPLRAGLIRKGMIFSPAHGDTAFTVPMFDEFMKRIMPRHNL